MQRQPQMRLHPVRTPVFPLQQDAIAASSTHTCALKKNGETECWGVNGESGNLGNNSTVDSAIPVTVDDGNVNYVYLSSGKGYDANSRFISTCAFTGAEGVCWGSNVGEKLGNSVALTIDNITFRRTPVTTTRLDKPAIISVGGIFGCAVHGPELRASCWGDKRSLKLGSDPDLGIGIDASFNPIDVRQDGIRLENVTDISAGDSHACALSQRRTIGGLLPPEVSCWGSNGLRQLGLEASILESLPFTVTGFSATVKRLSAGFKHTCALLVDGKVACWGANTDGQLGDGTTELRQTPVNVIGINDAIAVSSGFNSNCALRATGAVMCWGNGASGQLGHGLFTNSLVPVSVQGLQDAVAITVGKRHSCAIRDNKDAVCWGSAGQLGVVSTADSAVPVRVLNPANNFGRFTQP
jgi:alpha-tubulin suppressor-like RCC1 family protein